MITLNTFCKARRDTSWKMLLRENFVYARADYAVILTNRSRPDRRGTVDVPSS